MRQNKFKVWDKKTNDWLNQDHYKIMLGQDGSLYNCHPQGLYKHEGERWIPIFFIGKIDKNGKEIHEGDVCEIEFHDNSKEKLLVIWDEGQADFRFSDMGNGSWRISHTPIEILGNIHQNPELLK